MKRIFLSLMLTACALQAMAQDAPPIGEDLKLPADIRLRDTRVALPPEVDRHEVDRRGSMVQELGVINEGPVDLIADSLAPPANDSDKWFIYVVTNNDAASEQLKQHFAKSKDDAGADNPLQSWAIPGDPVKSWAHYNVIRWEDSEQSKGMFKDWFAKIHSTIQTEIAKGHSFPVVIMQPPKSGKYGENKNVVAMLFGYSGNPAALAGQLGYAQQNYVASLIKSGKIHEYIRNAQARASAFDAARKLTNAVADPPEIPKVGAAQIAPFNIPNQPLNPLTPLPGGNIPPMPQYLTLQHLQGLIPDAPPEYMFKVLQRNPTTSQAQQIQMEWMQEKANNGGKAPLPNSQATSITSTGLLALLGLGNFAGLIAMGWGMWRTYAKLSGKKMMLDDSQYLYLLQVLGLQQIPMDAKIRASSNPENIVNQLPNLQQP